MRIVNVLSGHPTLLETGDNIPTKLTASTTGSTFSQCSCRWCFLQPWYFALSCKTSHDEKQCVRKLSFGPSDAHSLTFSGTQVFLFPHGLRQRRESWHHTVSSRPRPFAPQEFGLESKCRHTWTFGCQIFDVRRAGNSGSRCLRSLRTRERGSPPDSLWLCLML